MEEDLYLGDHDFDDYYLDDFALENVVDPADLAIYNELNQFKPRGSGHFLNKTQRRNIVYGHNVLHMSATEIHNYFFEGANRDVPEIKPLCTIGRIRDILATELQDPQHYVVGPYKRRGTRRRHLIRGSFEAVSLLDLFSDGEYTSYSNDIF